MASSKLKAWRTQKNEWRQIAQSGSLYAIVQTRGPNGVREKARELGPDRAVSLFAGSYEAQYENAAPFIFRADQGVFDWIADTYWGKPWGILIWAHAGFAPLRAHLQRFLRVSGVDRQQYLFRFYDPYILPAFLNSCNDAELRQFFGPVRGFGATRDESVILFRMARAGK